MDILNDIELIDNQLYEAIESATISQPTSIVQSIHFLRDYILEYEREQKEIELEEDNQLEADDEWAGFDTNQEFDDDDEDNPVYYEQEPVCLYNIDSIHESLKSLVSTFKKGLRQKVWNLDQIRQVRTAFRSIRNNYYFGANLTPL